MPILRRKNITVSLPDLSAAKFPHDKLWLGEAIENILKNAADHSGCTHIQLEVSDTPALLTLSLTDNGKGIPQSRIPALFARFSKSSSGTLSAHHYLVRVYSQLFCMILNVQNQITSGQ